MSLIIIFSIFRYVSFFCWDCQEKDFKMTASEKSSVCLVLLIGLPAAGKTTFAQKFVEEFDCLHPRLALMNGTSLNMTSALEKV